MPKGVDPGSLSPEETGKTLPGACRLCPKGPPPRKIKAASHLAEKAPSKVMGLIPSLTAGAWKAAVKTRFSGSRDFLKPPRVIERSFTFTAV
jgi:hypothetical protein